MRAAVKKFICLFVSFLIILNCSAFTNVKSVSKGNLKTSIPTSRANYGFVKPKFKITRKQQNSLQKGTNLPSKYDLRDCGGVTPVKSQGQIGDCWAFAAMSSLESCIKVNEGEDYDFSEINLAVNNGTSMGPDDGGNQYMATGYFARWGGPVNESDDPYPNPAEPSNIVPRSNVKPARHIQDVLFIPARNNTLDNDLIKKAIMQYGAVDSSIYLDHKLLYYKNHSYYCYDTNVQNHGITIVGWDDSYSKNNFYKTPPGDGAFICKNSWGTDWGDEGYFYASYYINYKPTESWFSNVFTADASENLTAASFYTDKMNISYEIYVENDFDDYGFNRIKSNKVKSGSIEMPGYHTIKFDKSVSVIKGKKFAVAVKINCSEGAYVVKEDTSFKDPNTIVSSANQSYTSEDGVDWKGNLAGEPNVCLKAFTNNSNFKNVSGVTLNTNQLNLNIGSTYKLNAVLNPSDATQKDVSWSSSDEKILTVDEDGNITPKSIGTAVVTVTTVDGYYKAQCKVYVKGELKIVSSSLNDYDRLPVDGQISLKFNSNIKSNTGFANIVLKDENGVTVPINKTISGNMLSIKPISNLKPDDYYYTLIMPKDAVIDIVGNLMSSNYSCKFLTNLKYNDSVYFDSPYLENEVRKELDKPKGNITSEDMKDLIDIDISDENIKSLKGLEYAVNLNYLDITFYDLYDISYIKNLVKLGYVSFKGNHISDISPLKNLTKLETLGISTNPITDITPISNLM